MKLSFIIPAYNEEDFIVSTLSAIHASAGEYPYEVIVVDNNSDDKTAELAESNNALVVKESVNQISRARNAGAKASTGDILIFIDADTSISAPLVTETVQALNSGQVAGGGTLLELDCYPKRGDQLISITWNAISRISNHAAGAYIYCLRQAFEETGGFDEEVYVAEDVMFSRSLKKWAKKNKKIFKILKTPVVTSARKLQWYSRFHILKSVLKVLLKPDGFRSKDKPSFWYKKPKK